MPGKVAWPAAWVLVLVLAAGLRLHGAGHLLPFLVEPDCCIPVQVELIESGREHPRSVFGWESYPHFLARLTQLTTRPLPPPAFDAPLEQHLTASGHDILRVRLVSAWVSVTMVLGTLLLARQVLSPGWTIVAGLLAATSLLATHFAPQARPHAAAAGLVALALAAAASLPARPTLGRYALTAALAGLALGTLQSALALGPPLLAAHLLAQRGRPIRAHLKLLVPLSVTAVAVAIFYPFFLEPPAPTPAATAKIADGLLIQGGHKVMLDAFDGRGFRVLLESLAGWEPALLVGAASALLVGGVGLLRRRGLAGPPRPAALVMLAYAMPYGLVIGLYARSYERFLLPLLPLLAIFSAWGLMRLASSSPRARVVALAMTTLLIASSGALAWRLGHIRSRPSTIEEAQRWLMARLEPGSPRLWLLRPHTLPLLQDLQAEAADEQDLPTGVRRLGWAPYRLTALADHPGPRVEMAYLPIGRRKSLLMGELPRDPESYLARLEPGELVLAEVYTENRYLPVLSHLTRELRGRYPLEARFDTGDGLELPLGYQDHTGVRNSPMAWRVLRSRRVGPVLEVYRLRDPVGGG
jgi:hypothetical protein